MLIILPVPFQVHSPPSSVLHCASGGLAPRDCIGGPPCALFLARSGQQEGPRRDQRARRIRDQVDRCSPY